MELELRGQAAALALALALGALLGLGYDLMRPPRRGLSLGPVLDLAFALLAFCSLFLFAMGRGQGRLGTWTLAMALLGFLIYLHLFSRYLSPPLEKAWTGLMALAARGKEVAKKSQNLLKTLFSKIRECFTIKT